MNEYWNAISGKHQERLRQVADRSGISVERAMRNLIQYLKSENCRKAEPVYMEGMITGRQIEVLIDSIAG